MAVSWERIADRATSRQLGRMSDMTTRRHHSPWQAGMLTLHVQIVIKGLPSRAPQVLVLRAIWMFIKGRWAWTVPNVITHLTGRM